METNKTRTPFEEYENFHLEQWNGCASRQFGLSPPVAIMCDPDLPMLTSSEEEQVWSEDDESEGTQSR